MSWPSECRLSISACVYSEQLWLSIWTVAGRKNLWVKESVTEGSPLIQFLTALSLPVDCSSFIVRPSQPLLFR